MVVGICEIDLLIHNTASLKDKRGILKGIIEKTKNKFNISIAEVGDNNVWQRSQIGFCVIGNDMCHVNSSLDKTIDFIDNLCLAEIINHRIEIINC